MNTGIKHLLIGIFFTLGINSSIYSSDINIIKHSVLSKERLGYIKEYAKQHYNINHYFLRNPQIIVIHYTAIGTLDLTLKVFQPAAVSETRVKLIPFGKLNVTAHYVIDRNGDIYETLPTNIMGRHTTGYNHTAIGIENVASSGDNLTDKQLETNIKLVKYLTDRHKSINYLIGHHEYMNRTLPHFKLYLELDPEYFPMIKVDPGFNFMKMLRRRLFYLHGLELEK